MTAENEFFGSEDLRPPTGGPPSGPDPDESQAVNRSTMPRPGLPALLRAGLRGLRRYPGLAATLYLVQVALSAGAALVAMMMLVAAFGERPLFDRAMDGDLAALIACFRGEPGLALGLFWIAASAVLLYSVVSWFLTAGLVAVFLDVPSRRREVARWFGSAGASNFFPFVRLALWSALPCAVVLGVAGVGFVWVRDRVDNALTMRGWLEALAIGLSPGLLLHWIVSTAIDYARIDLVRHPGLSSLRALMRGFRLVARHRLALVHTLLYGVVFIGVTALYDWMTVGGAMSLLGLVVVRQISSLVRFAAHFGLIAGQVELGCTTMGTPLARRR